MVETAILYKRELRIIFRKEPSKCSTKRVWFFQIILRKHFILTYLLTLRVVYARISLQHISKWQTCRKAGAQSYWV